MAPWVLHVDMDQFIAAVEVLRRPELVGLPVIVGGRGDPTERGVVSTASYEARAFGVRSGMPLRLAVRRCPDAVVLPVDHRTYDAASAVVMATLRAVPGAVVEVLGWDEAFVGVEADVPEDVARRIQADVLAATDLHCSVGIGDTKVRAKIATEFGKPQGMFRLTRETWFDVMGGQADPRPVGCRDRASPSVSPGSGSRPSASSPTLRTPCWQASSARARARTSGASGAARAARRWTTPRGWRARTGARRPTSRTSPPATVEEALRVLAAQVVDDIDAEGRACARVHLKVRFAPFFTVNRSRKLAAPTFDAGDIADTALALYQRLADERPVRLLGIRAEMVPPEGGYDAPRTHGRRGMP